MKNNIKNLAKKLRASSDPNRLEILCTLFEDKKVCVSEIAKKLNLDIAIVSYHLQTLAREKIIKPERNGKMICYELEKTDLIDDLKNLICKHK